jgi:hypothetical protein
VDLPAPTHFKRVAEIILCGLIPSRTGRRRKFIGVSYNEVYIQQIGPNQKVSFFKKEHTTEASLKEG